MRSEGEFLVDVLSRLNQSGLSYMLTGSMASNYWGMPRTTHDLNFVIAIDRSQVGGLVSLFQGMFIQAESVMQAFRPPHQFNVIDEQSALKADFWLLRDNDFERAAFDRRIQVNLFGSAAWIATAEDIILQKLHLNRKAPSERQVNDAAGVFEVQSGRLDLDYLRTWADWLKVENELLEMIDGTTRPKET